MKNRTKPQKDVLLPCHKWHGFPPREENASGVLKKCPCDSSHNINVGDFSLGFTLNTECTLTAVNRGILKKEIKR